jgi:hypothetical protein
MNSIFEIQAQANEVTLDEQLLRDLAEVELLFIGGGEAFGTAR